MIDSRLTENIRRFADIVVEQNHVHGPFMKDTLANLSSDEIRHLDAYIDFCIKKGYDTEYLAKSYRTIVMGTVHEQIYFRKHGRYRHSTFAEVASDVYFNAEYMSHYMYGLALTSYFWPNHLAMLNFFKKTLPQNSSGRYLEVGPGHGYYLMTAMLQSRYGAFLGVDISETSVAMTKDLINHFMAGQTIPFELRCLDFLAATDLQPKSFDAVVMGEVLEHVEQPQLFLRRIRDIAKDDAYIYITTCVNAPEIDHIYLFKSPEEVMQLFASCGLGVREQLICPYAGKTLQESIDRQLAVNMAYVIKKI